MYAQGRDPDAAGEVNRFLTEHGYLNGELRQPRTTSGQEVPTELKDEIDAVAPERALTLRTAAVRKWRDEFGADSPGALYLKARGIPHKAASLAACGWIPVGDDEDFNLPDESVSDAELIAAGVLRWAASLGRCCPCWFRGQQYRLVVPALDTRGVAMGIILRTIDPLPDTRTPKELSPSAGYGDVRVLGLDQFGDGSRRHNALGTDQPVVVFAEGTTDYLTVRCALGMPVLAVSGASKWQRLREHEVRVLLPEQATIVIAFDADEAGRKAAARLASALAGTTQRIIVAEPGRDGADLNDLLLEHGPDALRNAMLSAGAGSDPDPSILRVVEQPAVEARLASHKPVRVTGAAAGRSDPTGTSDDGGRRRVEVTRDLHVIVEQTVGALAANAPTLYKRSGNLVHVTRDENATDEAGIHREGGGPRIRTVHTAYLRELMSSSTYFYRPGRRGEEQVDPPSAAASAIAERGHWPQLRELTGITEVPALRPDGTIFSTPGWDRTTGLLLVPTGPLPDLPPRPTIDDAMAGMRALLDLVADFPFAKEEYRAAWLSGLLTVLGRRAVRGPTPLHLIDANTRGSGKSMLTDVISILATGRSMPRFSNPRDDDEARKRITAIAIAGDSLVLIDNITGLLGGGSLDAALTSTTWKDRLLGKNENIEMPLTAVWFATGNNVQLRADTSRRTCHIRLDSPLENPEERTDFRYPHLLQHVREHRAQLVGAGLTVLAAYLQAGRPNMNLVPWGSFELWSDVVRSAIVWVGLPDPGQTRRELAAQVDTDALLLRTVLASWDEVDPDGFGLTSAELATAVGNLPSQSAIAAAFNEICNGKLYPKAIGYGLRKFKGRVVDGKCLAAQSASGGKVRWCVQSADARFGTARTGTAADGCDGGDSGDDSDPSRTSISDPSD